MIEILDGSEGNCVGVRATGKLTDEDYRNVWIPKLEEVIAAHGAFRCLLHMDEGFEGWELGAMWDDMHFGFKHRKEVEKIAVVGGPSWAEWSVKLGSLLVAGEVKAFPADKLNDAWDWALS